MLLLNVESTIIVGVIINDDIVWLAITFTSAEYDSTGMLEHGGQVGDYERLR